MNLDRLFVDLEWDQLGVLLLALVQRVDSGLTENQVRAFCAAVDTLEPDDDELIEPMVEVDGELSPLVVNVFAQAGDELEVVFLVTPRLRNIIEEQIRSTLGDVSIVVSRAPSDDPPVQH